MGLAQRDQELQGRQSGRVIAGPLVRLELCQAQAQVGDGLATRPRGRHILPPDRVLTEQNNGQPG